MTVQLYEGTKRLTAQPMTRGEYNAYRGWQCPADENPADDGYLVEYQDGGKANDARHVGYISWSPADVFERSYKPVPAGMTFGQALVALRSGQRIARTGWNGKGVFVYLVPAASYPVQTGAVKAHFGEGAMVPYNPYLAIKNVDESVSTWVPSANDCLAGDWGVVGQAVPGHQQRVLNEKMELDLRISALDPFIDRNPVFATLPTDEQARRKRQLDVMHELSSILGERIANF